MFGLRPSPKLRTFWRPDPDDGNSYWEVLSRIHAQLRPSKYLEIGVNSGDTFTLATCPSIGVDPAPVPGSRAFEPADHRRLVISTSDDFFASADTALLEGGVDFAFLDGMHWSEFLLRDFCNTERHCKPGSLIVMHDCLPVDSYVARREQADTELADKSAYAGWWAGDVWKVILVLQRLRPDVALSYAYAFPTGLIFAVVPERASPAPEARLHADLNTLRRARFADVGLKAFTQPMRKLEPADLASLTRVFRPFT